MHESIIDITHVDLELSTTCSQVPFREEIKILILSQQYPNPNIELSLMNQQRSFDVLLNDESVKFYFFEILVI
jgi:hypothetical protein